MSNNLVPLFIKHDDTDLLISCEESLPNSVLLYDGVATSGCPCDEPITAYCSGEVIFHETISANVVWPPNYDPSTGLPEIESYIEEHMTKGKPQPLYMVFSLKDKDLYEACLKYDNEEITLSKLSSAYTKAIETGGGRITDKEVVIGCLTDLGNNLALLSTKMPESIYSDTNLYLLVYAASWDPEEKVACANPLLSCAYDSNFISPEGSYIAPATWLLAKKRACLVDCGSRILWHGKVPKNDYLPPTGYTCPGTTKRTLQCYLEENMIKQTEYPNWTLIFLKKEEPYEAFLDWDAGMISDDELYDSYNLDVLASGSWMSPDFAFSNETLIGCFKDDGTSLINLSSYQTQVHNSSTDVYMILFGCKYDEEFKSMCVNPALNFKKGNEYNYFFSFGPSQSTCLSGKI